MDYVQHENGVRVWPTLYRDGAQGVTAWTVDVVPVLGGGGDGSVVAASLRIEWGRFGGKAQHKLDTAFASDHLPDPVEHLSLVAAARWYGQRVKGFRQESPTPKEGRS